MRRKSLVLMGVVALVVAGWLAPAWARCVGGEQLAGLVQFTEPVRIFDAIVMGKVLFQHDGARAAAGKPCTRVFQLLPSGETRLVTEFDCKGMAHKSAADRTIIKVRPSAGAGATPRVVTEFQIAGSRESHVIPAAP
jgi:hypothetical protein